MALRVCVTGAAGQIAYSLLHAIAKGDVFGKDQQIVLSLLDIAPMIPVLNGVVMELEDCSLPLLQEIIATSDEAVAFKDIDIAVLVGSMPRKEGMERKDLLKANAKIFISQGKALNEHAKRTVKVLVVGNPANTNCLIAANISPNIPNENFTCLTRLDHNRAIAQLSNRLKVPADHVSNVIIWGNHSSTQYPDPRFAVVKTTTGMTSAKDMIADDAWIQGDFIKTVQQRGSAILKARKLSSAMSAAKAICDHLRDWMYGTKPGEFVSMGVMSDGSYDVPKGLIYSFPVTIKDKNWEIVQGLTIDAFSRQRMDTTAKELSEEKASIEFALSA